MLDRRTAERRREKAIDFDIIRSCIDKRRPDKTKRIRYIIFQKTGRRRGDWWIRHRIELIRKFL